MKQKVSDTPIERIVHNHIVRSLAKMCDNIIPKMVKEDII